MSDDLPGGPIDPDLACSLAQDPSYSYSPTVGAWAKDGSMWTIDTGGALVTTADPRALRVYGDAADKLARSTMHSSATFTTGGTDYQLHAEGAQAVATPA